MFKQITEAYAILSDDSMRVKYDRLIFGESQVRDDDDAVYGSYSGEDRKKRKVEESYEQMQARVREKLKTF